MDKERLFLLDAILQADSGRVKTKNKEENTHDYLQKHRVPVAADGGGGDPAAGRGRGEEAGDGAGAEGCGEEKGTVHDIQKMLEPTGKVWDFETLGGIMFETEHN